MILGVRLVRLVLKLLYFVWEKSHGIELEFNCLSIRATCIWTVGDSLVFCQELSWFLCFIHNCISKAISVTLCGKLPLRLFIEASNQSCTVSSILSFWFSVVIYFLHVNKSDGSSFKRCLKNVIRCVKFHRKAIACLFFCCSWTDVYRKRKQLITL